MLVRANTALEKTHTELIEIRKQLKNKWFVFDPKRRLILIGPIMNGLWPECESLTFKAFTQIRSKSDWDKVKNSCIRTEKTVLLYDLLKRRFGPKKRARV